LHFAALVLPLKQAMFYLINVFLFDGCVRTGLVVEKY